MTLLAKHSFKARLTLWMCLLVLFHGFLSSQGTTTPGKKNQPPRNATVPAPPP